MLFLRLLAFFKKMLSVVRVLCIEKKTQSIAIRIDSVLRNFRASHHLVDLIIFMYSNNQFLDNFKQNTSLKLREKG